MAEAAAAVPSRLPVREAEGEPAAKSVSFAPPVAAPESPDGIRHLNSLFRAVGSGGARQISAPAMIGGGACSRRVAWSSEEEAGLLQFAARAHSASAAAPEPPSAVFFNALGGGGCVGMPAAERADLMPMRAPIALSAGAAAAVSAAAARSTQGRDAPNAAAAATPHACAVVPDLDEMSARAASLLNSRAVSPDAISGAAELSADGGAPPAPEGQPRASGYATGAVGNRVSDCE